MKRIKTFEDACNAIHISPEDPRMRLIELDITPSHIKAEMKLEIIQEALNKGWKFIPDGQTYGYWPWFYYYTPEEMERYPGRSFVDFSEFSEYFAGIGCAASHVAGSHSSSAIDSLLASRTQEISNYFGTQFAEIWRDYLCIKIK